MRKQTPTISDITFSIVKIIDKANKNASIYFEINDELSDFNNDSLKDQFNELEKVTLAEKQALTEENSNKNNMQQEMIDKPAKSPDFFQDNKATNKNRKKIYNNM